MTVTLREFFAHRCFEEWNGTATAFKSGAKARITGKTCGYVGTRWDFQDAWQRGWVSSWRRAIRSLI